MHKFTRDLACCGTLLLGTALLGSAALGSQSFPNFESPQIRPIAIDAAGLRLLVVNTPDARVALFSLADPALPVLLREISVGLEPVTARFRTANEAWVVCHLSDAISVVDLDDGVVTATIQLDDEPSDLVFAAGRAFVTIATRREVAVVDTTTHAITNRIPIFGDEPRWATASADGSRLYVAVHKSGNDTTAIPEQLAPPQPPPTNPALPPAPSVALIVDSEDPAFAGLHNVVLPDDDVFEIDTTSLQVTRRAAGVGTILFGMATHPSDGSVWVAATDARNLVRFEPAQRGHSVDHAVTRINPSGANLTTGRFDLNPGVNYAVLPNPGALATALAQPTDIAFAPNGSRLFVAAFGTDRIGVVNPANGAVVARVEIGPNGGTTVAPRRKRGPRGLAHHPTAAKLYVVNRLSNTLSVVDTQTMTETHEQSLVYDPTPVALKEGRGFLYDAKLSGNGTQSCAVCHIDATTDNLAWDLGDPGGSIVNVGGTNFHPMKGPMTTQALVGLDDLSPLHWRGDKARFQDFNSAFDALMGGAQISTSDMNAYTAFINSVVYPANPNQNRDRSYKTTPTIASPEAGRQLYTTTPFLGGLRCVDCHSLFVGSDNRVFPGALLQEPQPFRTAQLRNLYKRDGRKPGPGGVRTSGFGVLHDGTEDDVADLLGRPVFGPLSVNTNNKARLRAFVESFDTGTAPVVGFTLTFDATNITDANLLADRNVLLTRSQLRDCDIIVRGTIDGEPVGMSYSSLFLFFTQDQAAAAPLRLNQLDQLVSQGRATLTFIGVPFGQGRRMGIDRDLDGTLDGDVAATDYGSATAGCSIELRANSPAFIGNDAFALVTDGATPGAIGSVFVGFAAINVPVFGIDLLVQPVATLSLIADARGTAAVALPIPNDPGIVGFTAFTQSVFIDGCGPFGIGASQGVRYTIH